MKPAICPVCGRSAIEIHGDMVEFADYAPLPEGHLGNPQGLEWFCDDHLNASQATSGKSCEEAIKLLKQQYGTVNTPPAQLTKPTNENFVGRIFKFLKN